MKKRLFLTCLVLACLLFALAIVASAEATPSATISGHNLSLKDNIYIIYYASFDNLPAGAEKGILIWTDPQADYAYGTESARLSSLGLDGSYEKFAYTGVSAKMMSQDIYARPYVKSGETISYGKLDKYSVLQYAYNKKGSTTMTQFGDLTLGALMTEMLEYGTVAQRYFGYHMDRLANATYYQIAVVGGTLADGTRSGYDCELTRRISASVNVPVIASGGAGELRHLSEVIETGLADAVLAAGIFHFGKFTIVEAKEFLRARGIPVRLTA